MQSALSVLGLDPGYHMFELFLHLEHVPHWNAAFDGVDPDWGRLLAGYRATLDRPSTFFWRELATAFPVAEVLLTVRDPHEWFTSFDSTVLAVRRTMVVPPGPPGDVVRLIERCLQRAFGPDVDDRDAVIAAYLRHNAEVARAFDSDRVLVCDVSEGWPRLCRWLGVPVPDEPFPRLNTRDDFRRTLALDPVPAGG